MFKRIFKGVGRAFKGVKRFAKKIAPVVLAGAAVFFMAGGALGIPSMIGGWQSAVSNLVSNLGGQGGMLSNVLQGSLVGAGRGAAVGAATNAIRGQSISGGAQTGAMAGAAVGAGGGLLKSMGGQGGQEEQYKYMLAGTGNADPAAMSTDGYNPYGPSTTSPQHLSSINLGWDDPGSQHHHQQHQQKTGLLAGIGRAAGKVGGFVKDNADWIGPGLLQGAQAYSQMKASEPHQQNINAPWYDWYTSAM